jgi:glycosyltransferase involved in cell wall biosynthesis
MRIGVDATCWNNNRGYGRHARALLGALVRLDQANEYTLFFDSKRLTSPPPEGCCVRYVDSGVPASEAASASGQRSLVDMWRVSQALSAGRFDTLVFPTVYTYVPSFSPAKKIVFLHDVIAETFPELTLPRWSARQFWRAKVAAARFQADAIVTVSDYSKRRLSSHFGTRPDKIHVVGEAPDPVFRVLPNVSLTPKLAACGIREDTQKVVYLGGFGPHKNVPALLEAFAGITRRYPEPGIQLVLVGEYQKEVFYSGYDDLQSVIGKLGIKERTLFTGYLPDEDVAILLNLSDALVLPSLMEGYGLPAVEAAACGCPVIATTESPLAELLGDGAIAVTPDSAAVGAALERVLTSGPLRSRMRSAGIQAVQKLTWEAAARQMMDVLAEVGHRPARGTEVRAA